MTVEKGVITPHLLLVLDPPNWLKYVGNTSLPVIISTLFTEHNGPSKDVI
jgi:hypothetical protein